uniref:Reverse transcriptase domain-containing protein n=1 Tax=Strongyloides venezuelensis TaxID=75913 RepID=A0A0K0FJJ8_STRVS
MLTVNIVIKKLEKSKYLDHLRDTHEYADDRFLKVIVCPVFECKTKEILSRLQNAGFRLKSSKCSIDLDSVKFLGYEFNEKDRMLDSERIKPLVDIAVPKNFEQVVSLMGSLSYYGNFFTDLHKLKEPFLQLLKKNAIFLLEF